MLFFARRLDRMDRKELHSVPGRIDTFEEVRLKDVGSVQEQRMAIEAYQDARKSLDAKNRRINRARTIAGFAGGGVAMAASFLTGGGPIYLAVAVGVGVVGELVNRWLAGKLEDPKSIESLKKFHPEAAALFEKLDRPELSRSHWIDPAEYAKLAPAEQALYDAAVADIQKHNRSSNVKRTLASGAARVSGYAGLALPMLTNWPSAVVNGIMIGGSLIGGFLANRYAQAVVPTKEV
ncbi:MAG: hypothetical protein AAF658_20055 [Myxococcota bacterium]